MASLVTLINMLAKLLTLAILARAFLSFLPLNPYHPVARFVRQITEPILGPLRRYVPPLGMIDITPIVAMILIEVVRHLAVMLIYTYS